MSEQSLDVWCSIRFCRAGQRGPLLSMGSGGLRTSSTDRCDREPKPQELGIYIYIVGGWAPCKLKSSGWQCGCPLPVFSGCFLLGAEIWESNQRTNIWPCPQQQQSLACRGHQTDRVTWLKPQLSLHTGYDGLKRIQERHRNVSGGASLMASVTDTTKLHQSRVGISTLLMNWSQVRLECWPPQDLKQKLPHHAPNHIRERTERMSGGVVSLLGR